MAEYTGQVIIRMAVWRKERYIKLNVNDATLSRNYTDN